MDPALTELTTSFVESTGVAAGRSVPMSHLSVEVGHLYLEDLEGGPEAVQRRLAAVAPWAERAKTSFVDTLGQARPRVSTCYLIDDYFSPGTSPAEVIPLVLSAAAATGVTVDYLARESSCATESGIAIAEMVASQIVAEPHPESNGARPAAAVSGWLSNGKPSPAGPSVAMKPRQWQPPSESAAKRHSIFIDVQLWSGPDNDRLYSCPFLAAVWQLARLGLLRHNGEPLLQPQEWVGQWPSSWQAMPGVVRLNPDAAPFSAYSTLSVISERFLPIEHAVRTILSQIAVDPVATEQIATQAKGDRLQLAESIVERLGYVFAHEPWEPVRRSPARRSKAHETAAHGPRPVPDPAPGEC
jgi:hypothetical protein